MSNFLLKFCTQVSLHIFVSIHIKFELILLSIFLTLETGKCWSVLVHTVWSASPSKISCHFATMFHVTVLKLLLNTCWDQLIYVFDSSQVVFWSVFITLQSCFQFSSISIANLEKCCQNLGNYSDSFMIYVSKCSLQAFSFYPSVSLLTPNNKLWYYGIYVGSYLFAKVRPYVIDAGFKTSIVTL